MKSLPGAALALCLMAGSAGAVTAPLMTVRIEPSAMDPTSGRGEVTVALTVPEAHIAAGAPVLSLVTMAPGMSAPEPVTDLVVRDSAGRLPLRRDSGPRGAGTAL